MWWVRKARIMQGCETELFFLGFGFHLVEKYLVFYVSVSA